MVYFNVIGVASNNNNRVTGWLAGWLMRQPTADMVMTLLWENYFIYM